MTHGTIGRTPNPHRLFAIVGMALGVFAIADALPQTFDPAGNNTRSRRCASRTP